LRKSTIGVRIIEVSVEENVLQVQAIAIRMDLRTSVESVETAVDASFFEVALLGSIYDVVLAGVLFVVIDLEEDVDVVVV